MKGTWVIAPVACLLICLPLSPSFASDALRCTGAQRATVAAPSYLGAVRAPLTAGPGLRTGKRAPLPQAAEGGASRAGGCEGCESWNICLEGLGQVGASTQVVPLKNGVMYVYTADRPADIRALQAVVAQHHERLQSLASTARLCPVCRALRKASRRGRLSFEVLDIDGGCIVVTTSSDPAVVKKIYAEAGISGTPRVKG